jgi:LPS export ABC transporter protein LptC
MLKKLAPIFFSAAVLFVLFLAFWQRTPGPRLTEIIHQMEVDMNILEFSMVQGHEGNMSWELFSDNAGYLEDKDIFFLDNPVITYHTRDDSGTMVVRASQGMVLQQENIVHLWPDVRADHGDIEVSSDKATYVGGDNHILLEDNVFFNGRGVTVKSPKAKINLDDELIISSGGVSTLFQ